MWGNIAIAFLLAFIVAFMATPYTMKVAKKVGAVDIPKDKRKMHKKAMPRFGRSSGNIGLFSIGNIFSGSNEYRRFN